MLLSGCVRAYGVCACVRVVVGACAHRLGGVAGARRGD